MQDEPLPLPPGGLNPGIHDIPAAAYHADPCPAPSLSRSIGWALISQSPLHAFGLSPKLAGTVTDPAATKAMDMGSALHMLLLGKGAEIRPIEAKDWRTNAAKEARDAARREGFTPLLSADADLAVEAASAIRHHLTRHDDGHYLAAPGRSEAVLIWREGDVWCRVMVDRIPDGDGAPLLDIKTTAGSARPEAWAKKLATDGYAFQAAFYLRGARALGLSPKRFLFVVAENTAPFATSIVEADDYMLAWADALVSDAITRWRDCLANNHWPAHQRATYRAPLPPWAEFAFMPPPPDAVPARKPAGFDRTVLNSEVPFA